MPDQSKINSENELPFELIPLQDGRTKALFTVPADLVTSLTIHPILCRGSSFPLFVDKQPVSSLQTRVLYTEYYSPAPKETAQDIYTRLVIRMEHSDSFLIASMLGSFLSE